MPPEGVADLVTFSYSLTMIPDWYAALAQAVRLLRPGGRIGVADFYVSRKFPAPGGARHSLFTRHFWPLWFSRDNVFLSADHLPYLRDRFTSETVSEQRARLPFLPGFTVPYYVFVGRMP